MPQILSSFIFHVALFLLLSLSYLYFDICIDYKFSVESRLHVYTFAHLPSLHLSIWELLNAHSSLA